MTSATRAESDLEGQRPLFPASLAWLGALAALALAPELACAEGGWAARDLDVSLGAESAGFWDHTYRRQGEHGRRAYEWYGLSFRELREPLEAQLPKDSPVLVLGSGDSELSADMAGEGWQVTSLDFSEEVTSYMRQRYPGLAFVTQDARNMSFPDGRFGSAVDKGLSDCIGTAAERRAYFKEVRRVLRVPGGALAVISQRPLAAKRDLGPGWSCAPRREFFGPLFIEASPNEPPKAQPGTEGQIPYYYLACHSLTSSEEPAAEDCEEETPPAEADADEL